MRTAAVIALLGTVTACSAAPDYVGGQIGAGVPLNTSNSDSHEARSRPVPVPEAFAGWDLHEHVAIEGRAGWWLEDAHGSNGNGGGDESTDGEFGAVAVMGCPVLRWPWPGPVVRQGSGARAGTEAGARPTNVTLYARGCAGPAWRWIDTSTSSVTRSQGDSSGVELALQGAGGVEVPMHGALLLRFEGSYTRIDPIEMAVGGVALVYQFGE